MKHFDRKDIKTVIGFICTLKLWIVTIMIGIIFFKPYIILFITISCILGGLSMTYLYLHGSPAEEDIIEFNNILIEKQEINYKMNGTCLICASKLAKYDVIIADDCQHTFHKTCYDSCQEWETTDTNICPVCSEEISKYKLYIYKVKNTVYPDVDPYENLQMELTVI